MPWAASPTTMSRSCVSAEKDKGPNMSDTATLPETIVRTKEKREDKTKRQPPYHVILLNDNDHSFEYVIAMLQKLFGHPPERGYQMAHEVHTRGRVIVDTTSKE